MIRKYITKKTVAILSVLFVLSFLASYLSSIQPKLFQKIIDKGILEGNINLVLKFLFCILGLSLLNSGIKILNNMSINRMGLYISKQLKENVIRQVFSSPLDFFDKVGNGELVQRIKEVDGISVIFNPQLLGMMVSIFTGIIAFIRVSRMDYKFIFIYLIAFPLLAFFSLKFSSTYKRLTYELVALNTSYSRIIHESVAGINEVKSNNLGSFKENSLNAINEQIYQKTKKQNTVFAFSSEAMVTINLLVTCSITLVFAIFFDSKNPSVGQYIELTQYSSLILAPAQMLSSCITIIQPIRILVQRLKFFENVKQQEENRGKNVERVKEIKYNNVSFSYGDNLVLNELSFGINKENRLLIQGKNGSGKTTIIKLLLRLYEDYKGEILINHDEIRTLCLADIRNRIGVVFQESFLFDGNLYENVVCGNTEVNDKELKEVLEVSGLLENMGVKKEKAEELFTLPIIEGGKNLSGGQKRMVSIARALLKKPDVLILDEPTTFLDQKSKDGIIKFIESSRDMILIVISHDTDLIKHFSNVLYLDKADL